MDERLIVHKLADTRDALLTAHFFGLNVVDVWHLAKSHQIKLRPSKLVMPIYAGGSPAIRQTVHAPPESADAQTAVSHVAPRQAGAKSRNYLSAEAKQTVITAWQANPSLTQKELATQFGLHLNTVGRLLAAADLTKRNRLTKEQAGVLKLHQEHPEHSAREISADLGINVTTVYKALRRVKQPMHTVRTDPTARARGLATRASV